MKLRHILAGLCLLFAVDVAQGQIAISGLDQPTTSQIVGSWRVEAANPGVKSWGARLDSIFVALDGTIALFEARTGVDVIVSTEIDSLANLESLLADVDNLIDSTKIDTEAELEALFQGSVNMLVATEIDASSEIAAIVGDETGTGALVFGTTPTIATPTLTLKQGTGASPTAEGDIQWDTDDDELVVGTGSTTKFFVPMGAMNDELLCSYETTGNHLDCNFIDSAQLANAVTGETGSGAVVFGTSPTIATPVLTLPDAAGDAPTTDGVIEFDRTSENIEVGNGSTTNEYVPSANVSGDVTMATSGAVTIAANAIEESMLKAVDAAGDEECLTYESTVGDFEWQTCASAGGDNLQVNGTAVTTTGNFADSSGVGAVVWDLTVAGDPDVIKAGVGTDAINDTHMADDDHGDISWFGGVASIDASVTITTPTLTMRQTIDTAEGSLTWDATDNVFIVGDGATTETFHPTGTFTDEAFCTAEDTGIQIDCDVVRIDSTMLGDNSVLAAELGANVVDSTHLENNIAAIFEDGGSNEIAVTSGMMNEDFGAFTCDGTSQGCDYDTGSVGQDAIATNGVGSDELAAGSVGAAKLADGDFGGFDVASGVVTVDTNAVGVDQLDLSIAPTWTGRHIFNKGISAPFQSGSGVAEIIDGGASADTLRWDWAQGSNFTVTLDEDTWIENPSNIDEGWASIRICQPGGGNLALVEGAGLASSLDALPVIFEGGGTCTTLIFESYDGTNLVVHSTRQERCTNVWEFGARGLDVTIPDSLQWRVPSAWTITGAKAMHRVAGDSLTTYDVQAGGTSIFSTLLTIDASEETSETAAASYVFAADHTLGDDEEIEVVLVSGETQTTLPQEATVTLCFVD